MAFRKRLRNNIDKRIDPRTFEEQGREELPQIHLGTSSYQMEKKGIQTERGNQNRKIIALNLEFRKLKEELSKLTSKRRKKNMRTKRNSLISMSTSVFIMTYREKKQES